VVYIYFLFHPFIPTVMTIKIICGTVDQNRAVVLKYEINIFVNDLSSLSIPRYGEVEQVFGRQHSQRNSLVTSENVKFILYKTAEWTLTLPSTLYGLI
jgi:hypothetical protein